MKQAIEFDLPSGYNIVFPYVIYPVAAISMTGESNVGRVGEDTFDMYLRYRYRFTRGCIFCIFQILRYRFIKVG